MSAKIEQLVAMRLNTYFKQQPVTPALTELKMELATDLNEAANDKERSGLDPEAAVAEAFSDFGDINELIKQVNAENGATEKVHRHQITVDEDGIAIDSGKMLKIDADGISINNGTIKADANGLKVGRWTVDANGINEQEDTTEQESSAGLQAFDLAGEYRERLPLVNERRVAVADLISLTIRYQTAMIKVLPTQETTDELIVREFMNYNNLAYQAQVSRHGGNLQIVQGKVPFLIPLRVHVQILVPAQFTGDLSLASRAGNILVGGLQRLATVALNVTSGSVRVAGLSVTSMTSDLTSGTMTIDHVQIAEQLGLMVKSGRVRLTAVTAASYVASAASGSITGQQLRGGGRWAAKSGSIKLAFAAVTGDTDLIANSGAIKVVMPVSASYRYELESQSGRVVAPRNARVDRQADGYQTGQVGATGTYLIHGRARSGNIHLS